MGKTDWIHRLAEAAAFSEEILPGVPILEIAGDNRILIERHKGVTEYGRERICVKVVYGIVCICGCGLELVRMAQEQLVISGRIDCIQIQRRSG